MCRRRGNSSGFEIDFAVVVATVTGGYRQFGLHFTESLYSYILILFFVSADYHCVLMYLHFLLYNVSTKLVFVVLILLLV